ncbi:MAG: hypothetical protein KC731_08005 [Myxococcales bacterium]|nr:hypothetical protein [Myxococcales bacterium]
MIAWPEGKRFAFTVFDDTDRATATNVNEVYALLRDLGMRTTKSVWPIAGPRHPTIPGDTCEDDDYRAFTLELADQGFEIGYHNATYHGVDRAETERALERFRAIYGHYPRAAANHADNDDALYWGAARLDGASRLVYRALQRFRGPRFFGHVAGDRRFWGDLCQRHIDYFRNFVFEEMDTLEACPYMPYFDPHRPYVTRWFASAEGATVADFNTTIREEAQDRLVAQGGACIMYTHFAKGFQDGSRLDRRFVELMTRLARLDGWFVPTSELLDHIVAHRATVDGSGVHLLTDDERRDLERRWLAQRIRSRIRAALVR